MRGGPVVASWLNSLLLKLKLVNYFHYSGKEINVLLVLFIRLFIQFFDYIEILSSVAGVRRGLVVASWSFHFIFTVLSKKNLL